MILEAGATDDAEVASAEFFDMGETMGTVAAAPYSLSLTNLGRGEDVLEALATDNDGNTTASHCGDDEPRSVKKTMAYYFS